MKNVIKIFVLFGLFCSIILSLKLYNSTKEFYKYYSNFSVETKKWVSWYMSLSEEERICIDAWPLELQNAIDDGFDFSRYIPKDR